MILSNPIPEAAQGRWSEKRARDWHAGQPWLVGCNFIPSGAINQLEMWQPETFNPEEINRELGWLAGLGMNTVRVFLHDLLWTDDSAGFLARINRFLDIASRHGIRTMPVFFDSCWHHEPKLGRQPEPVPGMHNSGWVQSPGRAILSDPAAFGRLRDYVTGVVARFRTDERVVAWDVWNEPDNANENSYTGLDFPVAEKPRVVLPLLARAFQWVREAAASQPVTSGIWRWRLAHPGDFDPFERLQLLSSDVTSFHCYLPPDKARQAIATVRALGRPLLCTEYLARGERSTFEEILPLFRQEKIAAYNWGAVAGKTGTIYPWSSWQKSFTAEAEPWHHDIFRRDGSPYSEKETAVIRSLLGKPAP